MRKLVALRLGIAAVIASGVTVVLVTDGKPRLENPPYDAIVWLPPQDTIAAALQVRLDCGTTAGAASVSPLKRGRQPFTKSEEVRPKNFTFTVTMRWGPDDKRSNSLLACLDGPEVAFYAIPD